MSARSRLAALASSAAFFFLAWIHISEAYTVFAKLTTPNGVATDRYGNVFTVSLDPNNAFQYSISKFTPDSTLVGRIASDASGWMATEPDTGNIWLLSGADGRLLSIDPINLQVFNIVNLRELAVDTTNIYDVATGTRFYGAIVPQYSTFGDFALLKVGNELWMFVAGFDGLAYQYVLRLRFVNQVVQEAKVVVTSASSLAGTYDSSHGIAVTPSGLVATTLGWSPPTGANADRLVVFSADFPENPAAIIPQYPLNSAYLFSSIGMTTDPVGNFYIATGAYGGGTTCMDAPAIITIPSNLNMAGAMCLYFENTAHLLDAAWNPALNILYIVDDDLDPFVDKDAILELR